MGAQQKIKLSDLISSYQQSDQGLIVPYFLTPIAKQDGEYHTFVRYIEADSYFMKVFDIIIDNIPKIEQSRSIGVEKKYISTDSDKFSIRIEHSPNATVIGFVGELETQKALGVEFTYKTQMLEYLQSKEADGFIFQQPEAGSSNNPPYLQLINAAVRSIYALDGEVQHKDRLAEILLRFKWPGEVFWSGNLENIAIHPKDAQDQISLPVIYQTMLALEILELIGRLDAIDLARLSESIDFYMSMQADNWGTDSPPENARDFLVVKHHLFIEMLKNNQLLPYEYVQSRKGMSDSFVKVCHIAYPAALETYRERIQVNLMEMTVEALEAQHFLPLRKMHLEAIEIMGVENFIEFD